MGSPESMSREQYDAIEALNYSRLKLMARSPAHFRAWQRPDSAAFRRGRVSHSLLFEPDSFEASYAVFDGKRRQGKAWDAFEAEHADREILSASELELARNIVAAVRAERQAQPYLAEGVAERTLQWTLGARKCKGRVDWISPLAMVDLKTTRNGSPDGFGRDSWNLGGHIQAAFYSDGYTLATGQALPYVLIAVEAEPPHVVQVYRVPEAVIAAGRRQYLALIDRLAECERTNRWPGYSVQELDLEVPRWAQDQIFEETING